jgi:hypothetical protein
MMAKRIDAVRLSGAATLAATARLGSYPPTDLAGLYLLVGEDLPIFG